jgi:lipid-binding SYLF domain-containing protein
MVALKMVADGMPIVLKVSSVMGGARGRGIVHLRYSNNKVS